MLVVDLRHWLLPNGHLAPQAKLAPHVARVVEAATSTVGPGLTNTLCRRRRCSGRIGAGIDGETITWSCDTCDEGGLITNWRGTQWDLSEVLCGPDDDELVAYVPLDELNALRELDTSPVIRTVLAGAPVVSQRACVTLTEVEVVELLAALDKGGRRRLHQQAQGRFDQILAAEQVPRRARAH